MVNCTKKAENASQSCYDFMNLLDKNCGEGPSYCDKYKADLIKECTAGRYSQLAVTADHNLSCPVYVITLTGTI